MKTGRLKLVQSGSQRHHRGSVCTSLGSMNIFTAPTAIYCFTSYDKCTYCKLLWIKASGKCPKCKCKM